MEVVGVEMEIPSSAFASRFAGVAFSLTLLPPVLIMQPSIQEYRYAQKRFSA